MILALDTETTGIDLYHGAKPFLVSTANEKLENTYWEWYVDPKTRQPKTKAKDLVQIQKTINEADELILQNSKFDYCALQALYGGKLQWNWDKVQDTLIAGHLLASNQPHDLTTMAIVYLGINIQPYEDKMKVAVEEGRRLAKSMGWRIAKRGLPEMPSAKEKVWKFDCWIPRLLAKRQNKPKNHPWWTVTSNYANTDPTVTMSLWLKQRKLLKERGLWDLYKCRMQLIPIIADMESRGVSVSRERLKKLQKEFGAISSKCHKTCIKLADGKLTKLPVNGSSNELKKVLFEKFKLVSPKKTPKGQPSTDKYVLDEWSKTLEGKPLEFINNLRTYRKHQTAIGYLAAYERFGISLEDWLTIHCSLNPTGTQTLRFSSSNPNEQNISKQEEVNTRFCFGPAEGREWWALDYENLELRIPAYESGEKELIYLFEHPSEPPYYGSLHLLNFHTVYPDIWAKAVKKVGPDEAGKYCKKTYASTYYQWCKNGGFAVQYGAVLRIDSLGTADKAFHREGAHAKIKKRFSKLEALNKQYITMANKLGYVETLPDLSIGGRGYPIFCTKTKWGSVLTTVPLNYHVQATAMWCTCKAMIRCYKKLQGTNAWIALQVHDEMVFDFPYKANKGNLEEVNKLRVLMERSGKDISIPLKVSVTYHPNNWMQSV